MSKKETISNKKRTKNRQRFKKQGIKKQQEEIDTEAYQKFFGDICKTIQQSKAEEDLRSIFVEAMQYMEKSLESKGYRECEVKILANLPKIGWLQCRKKK